MIPGRSEYWPPPSGGTGRLTLHAKRACGPATKYPLTQGHEVTGLASKVLQQLNKSAHGQEVTGTRPGGSQRSFSNGGSKTAGLDKRHRCAMHRLFGRHNASPEKSSDYDVRTGILVRCLSGKNSGIWNIRGPALTMGQARRSKLDSCGGSRLPSQRASTSARNGTSSSYSTTFMKVMIRTLPISNSTVNKFLAVAIAPLISAFRA